MAREIEFNFTEDEKLIYGSASASAGSDSIFAPALFTGKQLPKLEESLRETSKALKVRSVEAIACVTDFIFFRKYVCGMDTYPYMLDWLVELNTGESNKFLQGIAGDDICILAPRGSAKSTFLLQWVAWVIGTHAMVGISLKILYISYVIDVASSKSRQIKAIIESDKYQEVFPVVRPSKDKWSEREWAIDFAFAGLPTIEEPYTLCCSGLKGAINSKRSHLMIFDDLLKSPSEAKNKKIQDIMLENYNAIVENTKHDGARSINLGTRMAKFDIYATAFVEPFWKVIVQSALLTSKDPETGKNIERSYCEERITLETLQKRRKRNEEAFMLQLQNEIPEVSSIGIRPHHIKWSWMPAKFERIVIGLDTADSTGDNTNATAVIVLGIANDCIYVLDGYEERIQGNLKKIELIYDLWKRRKNDCRYPAILAVDWHSHVKNLEGDLEDFMEDIDEDPELDADFVTVSVEKIKSSGRGEKIDRIESHSYLFEKGRVFFNQACSSTSLIDESDVLKKVVSEITDHNPLAHNDLMDALEVAIYTARQYVTGDLSMAS